MIKKDLPLLVLAFVSLLSCSDTQEKVSVSSDETTYSGNPVFQGWYADPEGIIFDDQFWIYPTFSGYNGDSTIESKLNDGQIKARGKEEIFPQFLKQTFLDAFSSKDLVQWKKHSKILSIENVSWAAYAVWAPAVVKKNGRYYLFFGANDIKNNDELGGIGVAVSDKPEGPFTDALGKPLIGEIRNGAQPIDQFVFKDDDGEYYMYYGGWGHCNVVKMQDDLLGIQSFDDGETFKEITPENYVEGPFVFKRKGQYYMMWSEGGWTGPNYSVAYAIADSPLGPFKRIGKILQQDPEVATGAGHHSVISIPGSDEWYIVYHRRPLGETDGNHRVVCIDKMTFDEQGNINPVKITFEGVQKREL